MEHESNSVRSLAFLLLASSARVERRLDQELSNIKGVSFSEYQLLAALEASHESTATRVSLAQDVGLTPSGVTRALKPLEKIGLVKTTKDARDARRSLAKLTKAGAVLVEDATAAVNSVLEGLGPLASLKKADRAQLEGWLEPLSRA